MTTAQINLTNAEREALQALAQSTGKTESELLHEAVESYLNQAEGNHRLALLRQAKGIWKDRDDLPDFRALRAELDRD